MAAATILRRGKVVGSLVPKDVSAREMAEMMVGATLNAPARAAGKQGPVALRVTGLSVPSPSAFGTSLKDVGFEVRQGEVLGIGGVAGNGQDELLAALSGEIRTGRDVVQVHGRGIGDVGPNERRRDGICTAPEERLGHGAAPQMALSQNLLLSRHKTDPSVFLGALGTIKGGAISSASQRIIEEMDVRKSAVDPEAAALSGGNLQKFIIGRELDRKPAVMIVNQPTWGVDAGAAARIRQSLIELARSGSAVLVISQDLDELFEISDAIAVMHNGEMSAPIPIAEATYENIGLLMGGAEPGHRATPHAEHLA